MKPHISIRPFDRSDEGHRDSLLFRQILNARYQDWFAIVAKDFIYVCYDKTPMSFSIARLMYGKNCFYEIQK